MTRKIRNRACYNDLGSFQLRDCSRIRHSTAVHYSPLFYKNWRNDYHQTASWHHAVILIILTWCTCMIWGVLTSYLFFKFLIWTIKLVSFKLHYIYVLFEDENEEYKIKIYIVRLCFRVSRIYVERLKYTILIFSLN